MDTNETSPHISLEGCYEYLADTIFCYRSPTLFEKKRNWPGKVGIELEMQPIVDKSNSPPDLYPLFAGQGSSSSQLLVDLAKQENWEARYFTGQDYEVKSEPVLEKIKVGHESITFEPGGQIEFSTKPFYCLDEACSQLGEVQNKIKTYFAERGVEFLQIGLDPWHSIDESKLQMDKNRYLAMAKHFSKFGDCGHEMMRQTMSVQVNLDYGFSPETLIKRYIAANLISPFTTAIFSYSPLKNSKSSELRNYRANAWRHLEPTHTGFPNLSKLIQNQNLETCIQIYFDYVLDANVIFIESLAYEVPEKLSFREWVEKGYKGTFPVLSDFETHLTLMFPEVRPKKFLELRAPDGQAQVWQNVPPVFYSGLLYDEQNVSKILSQLSPLVGRIDELWEASTYGLANPELAKISKELMEWSISGIDRLPNCFTGNGLQDQIKAYAETFTFNNKTPADSVLDIYSRKQSLNFSDIKKLEQNWWGLVS